MLTALLKIIIKVRTVKSEVYHLMSTSVSSSSFPVRPCPYCLTSAIAFLLPVPELHIQADFRETAGSVSDHHSEANTTVKQVT